MVNINFYKSIYNEDIIYHYTKASTAIDFILFNNQLRFSKARNSIDPIESRSARRGILYYGTEPEKGKEKYYKEANELERILEERESQFLQICFCKNEKGSDFANKNYSSTFKGHEELFGFTKMRMWDQYADNYTGVCIALSKERILSLNKDKLKLITGDVQYLKFQDLLQQNIGDIQGNYLREVGKEKYLNKIEPLLKKSFFCKHRDYSGENEFRIGTLFDKDKCAAQVIKDEIIVGQNMMLDITGCIKAIFVSSFANNKQKLDLYNYANDLNIEMIEMKWQHDSFKAEDYKYWIKLIEDSRTN